MKILALTQGFYGERIVRNIKRVRNWTIKELVLPYIEFEIALDEPESIRIDGLEDCDILLSLCEEPSIPLILPTIVDQINVRSVIVAVDDPKWVGIGLEREIKQELKHIGIRCIFARPLCSLTSVGDVFIDELVKYFGRPKLKVLVNKESKIITSVKVERSAPCGSTYFVASKLKGISIDNAEYKAALLLQCYPCLASHDIDPLLGVRTIDKAAYMIMSAIKEALRNI